MTTGEDSRPGEIGKIESERAALNGPLILIGGGGHAKVVADAAAAAGFPIIGFLDDNENAPLSERGINHLGATDTVESLEEEALLAPAIGDNAARARIIESVIQTLGDVAYARLVPIVHPSALISVSVGIGSGVFIGPLAVINADSIVEPGAIVNSGAIVEHDNRVGRCAHIAPGAVLGGNVVVGDEALIGLGARVRPGVTISPRAVVGAGAVVVSDVAEGVTVRGVPARA